MSGDDNNKHMRSVPVINKLRKKSKTIAEASSSAAQPNDEVTTADN